ncbi:MAG: sigma-54-dependent Fis family transcriptional regulator [Planctomycetes bacterium]|nr:sigma-54-dependent Fis family transcriptional regulator [Planctomycetota bacterium]
MQNAPLSLLVVDDDVSIRRVWRELVGPREGVELREAGNADEALELLRTRAFDVAFLDLRMPGLGGLELLEQLKRERPTLEVVMVTAHGTIESAVQAMKLGAADFLPKPFKLDQVSLILERLRRVRQLRSENERLRKELQERYRARSLVGTGSAMDRCHELIDRVRREECNVLILGESGCGKDLIARAIHYDGPRRERPFVPVDCGAIHSTLLESELFGHEKGAFTGAHVARRGLFETATGGTVFLDEIGEIPLELQPALLRAIEEKQVRPVGSAQYRPVDVRIIAATNQPLEEMVAGGRFRRDLFYRLNVVSVKVPPLRERKDDIPLLVQHFLQKRAGRGGRPVTGISAEALHLLQRYDWPGNVRELEHAVDRACTLGQTERIEPGDLGPSIMEAVQARQAAPGQSIEEMEVAAIRRLLDDHGGDTARVAEVLGIDRSTLYRKIKRHKIAITKPK